MCGRSKGQTQSQQTTTTQATPEAMAAYQDVLERAQQVAATPYQAYTGDRVAGFTPFQEQAFGQIAGLQGAGMGTLGEAGDLARQGAQAISGEDIQRAMDPYQQQVIQTTMDEMARQNAIEQSRLQGQAISAGAYGGDRAGIAASELAKRQGDVRAATMANLLSQGYGRAVAQAQADRQAAMAGSGQLSALAQQEYALPMAQTQALGQAGTAQQQLAQMQLNVPYQQYLEERAYPFQTAQWLAGLTTGVGGAMGGTSSAQGTMTPAQPNPLNTILGLGLGIGGLGVSGGGTLLGNFLNRAEGGRVDDKAMDAPVQLPGLSAALPYSKGFVPTAMQYRPLPIPATSAPPVPQAPPSEAQKFLGQAMDLAKSIRDARKTEMPSAQSWASGTTITPETEATPTPEWGYMAHGGRVPMADGGVPVENIPVTEMPSDLTAPRRPNLSEVEAMSLPAPTERFSGPAVQPLDMEIPKFRGAAAYQPPSPPMAQPRDKDVTPPAETKSGFGLSPEAGQALMQAGFALMASRSPWLGQAVGEAGLVGTQAYTEAQKVAELRRKQTEAEKFRRERMEKDLEYKERLAEIRERVASEIERKNREAESLRLRAQEEIERRNQEMERLRDEAKIAKETAEKAKDPIAVARAKSNLKELETIKTSSRAAEEGLAALDTIENVINEAYTGRAVGPIALFFGQRETSILNSQSAALSLALAQKMKGALSDKDLAFLQGQVPGITTGPEAAKAISDVMRRGFERAQQRSDFFEDWFSKYRSLEGADRAWRRFVEENQLTTEDKKAPGGRKYDPQHNRDYSAYLDRNLPSRVEKKTEIPPEERAQKRAQELGGTPQYNKNLNKWRVRLPDGSYEDIQ